MLQECLASLPAGIEIIIIDNNSTDGSKKYLKSLRLKAKGLKLIFNNKNFGFAKAVNQGISKAKNDHLVVLNNDVVLGKTWFSEMTKAITKYKTRKIAAYFGKVISLKDRKIESTGLNYKIYGKSENLKNGSAEKVIFGAPAVATVYYRPALLKNGLFDEDFFAYLEDVDLALRLNSAGWKTVYLPKAVAYHYGGQTGDPLGIRKRLTARNWWFIFIKHYPIGVFLKNLPQILIEQGKIIAGFQNPFDVLWLIKELVIKFPKTVKKRKPLLFLKKYETDI